VYFTAWRDLRILRNCFKIRAHSPYIGRADAYLSRRMAETSLCRCSD
jgi:hypothetical protein